MIKVFISQPSFYFLMRGLSDEEILEKHKKAVDDIYKRLGKDVMIISSIFGDSAVKDDDNVGLRYLAKSIESMAEADYVYFYNGFELVRGCLIEHMCAVRYGKEIMYGFDDNDFVCRAPDTLDDNDCYNDCYLVCCDRRQCNVPKICCKAIECSEDSEDSEDIEDGEVCTDGIKPAVNLLCDTLIVGPHFGEPVLKVKLDEGAFVPERAHDTDGGIDIRTNQFGRVPANGGLVFTTGVHVELPHGYSGLLVSKSGLNVNKGLTSTGLIDEGFTGEIKVKLYNHTNEDYLVAQGDKISQLVLIPVSYARVVVVDEIDGGERGDDGYGSTGR